MEEPEKMLDVRETVENIARDKDRIQVAIRLPRYVDDILDAVANELNVSKNEIMVELIRIGIKAAGWEDSLDRSA